MAKWHESDALRSRLPWLVGVVAIGMLLSPVVNIVAVLVGGGDELSYDYGVAATSCRIEDAPCWTIVELQIGNTGAVLQDVVEVDLTSFPHWSPMGHRIVKIVASNRPLDAPQVTIEPEHQSILIGSLDANQMVEFELLVVGREGRSALDEAKPVVRASGRVVESNPKATALARAFRAAFAFLL